MALILPEPFFSGPTLSTFRLPTADCSMRKQFRIRATVNLISGVSVFNFVLFEIKSKKKPQDFTI